MNTTEQYLEYLAQRRRHLRREPWFYTYHAWMTLRGYAP